MLTLGALMASQEVLSCQSWWQLGMLPGRRCGCLDTLTEAWRHGCSVCCANNVLNK